MPSFAQAMEDKPALPVFKTPTKLLGLKGGRAAARPYLGLMGGRAAARPYRGIKRPMPALSLRRRSIAQRRSRGLGRWKRRGFWTRSRTL